MDAVSDWLQAILIDYFGASLPNVTTTDVIEVLLITYFFYKVLVWIKDTRAWMLFRGILVILAFFVIAAFFRMSTILWLGDKLISAGAVAIVVVFQPELRTALEQIGRSNMWAFLTNLRYGGDGQERFDDRMISDLLKACYEMGSVKTGALIVIEKDVQLTEYIRTGIDLDAILSRQILINIFEKNTPLHDGAIIVRGNRILAATCYLPLSDNMELSKDLGTRHRAAVGISEVCDGMTIVVSEETGAVSVAQNGVLYRDLKADELEVMLSDLQKITDDTSDPDDNTNKKSNKKNKKKQKDSKEVRP